MTRHSEISIGKISAPGAIRTHGPRIRNPVLYPPELRGPVWKTEIFNSGTLRTLPTPEVTADTTGRWNYPLPALSMAVDLPWAGPDPQ